MHEGRIQRETRAADEGWGQEKYWSNNKGKMLIFFSWMCVANFSVIYIFSFAE